MSEETKVEEKVEEQTEDNKPLLSGKTNDDDAPVQGEVPETPDHLQKEIDEMPVEKKPDPIKPEYLEEQYFDAKTGKVDTEQMQKNLVALREKMSAGKHKAPADGKYDLKFLGDAEETAVGDSEMQEFTEKAKEMSLSQDQYEQLINWYVSNNADIEQDVNYKRAEERSKLGKNADNIIKNMDGWLVGFEESGTLTKDEVESVANASTNATFISALNKIRKSYGEKTIPVTNMDPENTMTKDDLTTAMGDPLYTEDSPRGDAYRQKVERRWYEAHPNE